MPQRVPVQRIYESQVTSYTDESVSYVMILHCYPNAVTLLQRHTLFSRHNYSTNTAHTHTHIHTHTHTHTHNPHTFRSPSFRSLRFTPLEFVSSELDRSGSLPAVEVLSSFHRFVFTYEQHRVLATPRQSAGHRRADTVWPYPPKWVTRILSVILRFLQHCIYSINFSLKRCTNY